MTTIKNTPDISELEIPKRVDLPDDVIPLFGNDQEHEPSKSKILYDVIMLVLLSIDLLVIFTDNILMSELAKVCFYWFGANTFIDTYQGSHHSILSAIGGIFTLFWVCEVLVRWGIAIKKHTYFRWFFFPFVHWYEVLSCFPSLRALRLLRAGIIIKRLHDTGVKIVPEHWIGTAKFYYDVVLEELSDRVILTATDNIRKQMTTSDSSTTPIKQTLEKNKAGLETAILVLLRQELKPKLQAAFLSHTGERLSQDIGVSVEKALIDTPELRKYLKLIPIAGSMIEAQITNIGKHIGENVTTAINAHLFDEATLDELMVAIAKGVVAIDVDRPELQKLLSQIFDDVLSAFEAQIKVQQWKHKTQIKQAVALHTSDTSL